MAVYVDRMKTPLGRMLMSHMLADSVEELHAMADTIGIARKHFQRGTKHHDMPHYDICQAKRAMAIEAGAIEIGRRETALLMRKLRAEATRTK